MGENRRFNLPGIWWARQKTLGIPHIGMAVTNAIGNVKNIHPTNKSEVARRLALAAFADCYGKPDIVKCGPLFTCSEVTDRGIVVNRGHLGGVLATRDGNSPDWFEMAGPDGVYQKAVAEISSDGKSVLARSPAVEKPDRIRFAWSQTAGPNLMNREGLPGAAFNSHWPADPPTGGSKP